MIGDHLNEDIHSKFPNAHFSATLLSSPPRDFPVFISTIANSAPLLRIVLHLSSSGTYGSFSLSWSPYSVPTYSYISTISPSSMAIDPFVFLIHELTVLKFPPVNLFILFYILLDSCRASPSIYSHCSFNHSSLAFEHSPV